MSKDVSHARKLAYMRTYVYPAPQINSIGERWCIGDKASGTSGHFARIETFGSHKKVTDGLNRQCRVCARAMNIRQGPGRNAKKYGLAPGWKKHFSVQYQLQGGKCAICERLLPQLEHGREATRDHDHTTGKNRGVLCQRCNRQLGFIETFVVEMGLLDTLAVKDGQSKSQAFFRYLMKWRSA